MNPGEKMVWAAAFALSVREHGDALAAVGAGWDAVTALRQQVALLARHTRAGGTHSDEESRMLLAMVGP